MSSVWVCTWHICWNRSLQVWLPNQQCQSTEERQLLATSWYQALIPPNSNLTSLWKGHWGLGIRCYHGWAISRWTVNTWTVSEWRICAIKWVYCCCKHSEASSPLNELQCRHTCWIIFHIEDIITWKHHLHSGQEFSYFIVIMTQNLLLHRDKITLAAEYITAWKY